MGSDKHACKLVRCQICFEEPYIFVGARRAVPLHSGNRNPGDMDFFAAGHAKRDSAEGDASGVISPEFENIGLLRRKERVTI